MLIIIFCLEQPQVAVEAEETAGTLGALNCP